MLKLLDNALGRRRIADLDRTVQDQKKQIVWLERLVTELLVEQRGHCLMPPPHLRLHVGARESAANFWNQGRHSSARVIEVFGTDPEGLVLDWGCGSGRTLYWLYAYEGWKRAYRGCDVDEEAIGWLRKSQRIKPVAVCRDDPPLPYGDGVFSGLFCFSVLTHIHPLKHGAWYREIHRVLKPGGRAYLTLNGEGRADDPRSFTPSEREAFARQGWLWAERDGHYKGAAVAGRDFTLKALEGLFEIEQHRPFGYHNMDELIVRRL
jgi:SAM-dependent methyltransferase